MIRIERILNRVLTNVEKRFNDENLRPIVVESPECSERRRSERNEDL
jgi:hypothetical protein